MAARKSVRSGDNKTKNGGKAKNKKATLEIEVQRKGAPEIKVQRRNSEFSPLEAVSAMAHVQRIGDDRNEMMMELVARRQISIDVANIVVDKLFEQNALRPIDSLLDLSLADKIGNFAARVSRAALADPEQKNGNSDELPKTPA